MTEHTLMIRNQNMGGGGGKRIQRTNSMITLKLQQITHYVLLISSLLLLLLSSGSLSHALPYDYTGSIQSSGLGSYGSGLAYNLAYRADNTTNEFNTIEGSGDKASTPARYLKKLREMKGFSDNYRIKFGIGLESHFGTTLNIPYMRASIDTLAAANVPIWLTEVDVKASPNQAKYLEQVLREGYSHPKVGGIVVWGAWNPEGCFRMCLTDNKFRNLATGNVVDKLLLVQLMLPRKLSLLKLPVKKK